MIADLRRDKAGLAGMVFLSLLVVMAVLAPLLAPHDPKAQDLVGRLQPPVGWGGGWEHPLGTDALGQDVASRLMYGARVSLAVGLAVVLVSGTVGTIAGLASGYLGGWTDRVIMRIVDTQIAFPGLLVAILLASLIGPGVSTVIIVLSINGWMIYARMTRGVVLSVRETPYVEAAEIIGCRPKRVMFSHILPNLAAPLTTVAVLELARIILAEAALSYLGVGVERTGISWGLDVATGQDSIFNSWWLVVMPGVLISLTVLSVNLVASWLRIVADPTEREKRYAAATKVRARVGATAPVALVEPAEDGADNGAPLLAVDDLRVDFFVRRGTVHAVRGVSFEIKRGEVLGLVGESGSGKSVTSQAIMGLTELPGRITGGDVRWKGRSLVQGRAAAGEMSRVRGTEIAMVFQDPMTSLNPLFTIGHQMTEVTRRHLGYTKEQATDRAVELLDLVGIANPRQRLGQLPSHLSGGMRQRVLIAMALSCEPELLIADEPTTALDVTIQAQILELLADLQQRLGLAVLLITHDLGVVAGLCDRVAVMYGGRLAELAPADDIYARPAHPYAHGLLVSTPRLDGNDARLASIEGAPPDLSAPPEGCPFSPRCPSADERCVKELPELEPTEGGENGRTVACWHPVSLTSTG